MVDPVVEHLQYTCDRSLQVRHQLYPGRPAIVLSSGYGIFDFAEPVQVELTRRLSELEVGWIQYIYPERASDASTTDLSVSGGVLSLSQIFDWLRSRDVSKVGLFGISFGANISVEFAALRPVRLMLLINLVFDYIEYRRAQLGNARFEDWRQRNVIELDYNGKTVRSYYRFVEEVSRQRIMDCFGGIDCQVYAFQGGRDAIISTAHVLEATKLYPNVHGHVIAGADHAFTNPGFIRSFLKQVDPAIRQWQEADK